MEKKGCLDVASTHGPSTRSIFFPSRRSYRPAEGRVEAKRRQRPGPPPATTNRLLAEPGGDSMGELRMGRSATWADRGWTYRQGTKKSRYKTSFAVVS
jgi:hypothetical protein